tara:strand:- start:5429 stop:7498 length:2070 start_codon:yes stop_codon:yes gene_type:complete
MWLKNSILALALVISVPCAHGSEFGTSGVISIPSARMMSDGNWKYTISMDDVALMNNFSVQALPWLESTLRYTIFDPNDIGSDYLKDRSLDAKIRLIKERKYTPEIAIGARDIIGTGTFASEYFVASKKINNFDITFGLGWGRFSDRDIYDNPIGKINSHFYQRKYYSGGKLGGKFRLNSIFRGDKVGAFGGLVYSIDDYNLKLLVEYNSDEYRREKYFGTMPTNSPVNYGIQWQPFSNLSLGLNYKYGEQVSLSLASTLKTNYIPKRKKLTPFFSSTEDRAISNIPESIDLSNWYSRLLYDAEKSGLRMNGAEFSDDYSTITIEINNMNYNLVNDAVNRFLILANLHLPSVVKNINLIINEDGFRVATITHLRRTSERDIIDERRFNILEPRKLSENRLKTFYIKKFNTSFNLASKFQLFSPTDSLRYQIFGLFNASYRLSEGLFVFSSFSLDLDNDFIEKPPDSNSSLARVRTDIDKYLKFGETGIESLFLEKKSNLNTLVFYRFYAGILEQMYSGVGTEILYRPFRKRWALGATINYVRKRGFKRDFQHLDYKTTTSYLSLYYASPFYNYDFSIHAGKYLAKDKGFTLEIRRTFDNGFSIGAFASSTNVSADDFGEGSFDKGINFKIPFDLFSKSNTKNTFSNTLRSIQRDGGQRMDGFSGTLWHDLRDVRYDSMSNYKDRMTNSL